MSPRATSVRAVSVRATSADVGAPAAWPP